MLSYVMNGSNIQKLSRLCRYLVRHPSDLNRYFRFSLSKQSPVELELPWISFAAIDFLCAYLQPHHRVVEFGGGGSTLFFSKHVAHVLCLESSEQWADKIQAELALDKIDNVSIEVEPFPLDDLLSYQQSSILQRIDGEQFDVILVDGYEKDIQLRPSCFWHAENSIKEGGIIIVDDSWRYPILRENNKAKQWREFRSIGPCRPGVTSTDIYFY